MKSLKHFAIVAVNQLTAEGYTLQTDTKKDSMHDELYWTVNRGEGLRFQLAWAALLRSPGQLWSIHSETVGHRRRQSRVFVLCKSMHMRRGCDEQSGHVAPGRTG